MKWWAIFLPAVAFAASPEFRIERQPVAGGAELITVFGPLSSGHPGELHGDVPLLSILRDTLGDDDPSNDRLRDVWVLTSAKPSLIQRAAASLPFFYWRPDLSRRGDHKPVPVLDLGDTQRHVWSSIAGSIMQVAALDPNGALVRSSTRSYRTNSKDHRNTHLVEGLSVLSHIENLEEARALLSDREMFEIQARLELASQTLGGLVNEQQLPEAYHRQRARNEETRGHNWELLRQRAETNGLYFEPLGLTTSRTHALLWVAREDLMETMHPFDAKFLNIANPYIDARLKDWQGISVTAYFNASGYRVKEPVEGGWSRELVPLALYSLEYPKVPLLVVDFRAPRATKRREMIGRAVDDAVIGVLGISKWGNWPYFAGSWAYTFVRSRHGDTNNRMARMRSYSQARRWLALDSSLDPELKTELQKRLETMGVNPLEESVFEESDIARRQYAALLRYAQDPKGLVVELQKDREAERTAYHHGWKARAGLKAVNLVTLGAYHHKEPDEASLVNELSARRRDGRLEHASVPSFGAVGQ